MHRAAMRASLVVVAACGNELAPPAPPIDPALSEQQRLAPGIEYDNDWFFGEGYAELDVRDARLGGDLGLVRGIDAAARVEHAFVTTTDRGTASDVQVLAVSRSWAAMHILHFNADPRSLTVGTVDTWEEATGATSPLLTVVGCSGPEDGVWEFDEHAQAVRVESVEPGAPGSVRLVITAAFEERDPATYEPTGRRQQSTAQLDLY